MFVLLSDMIIKTIVACAVGPSVNTSRAQLIFPFKPNFCNLFEFSTTKSTQKPFFSHLNSNFFEINSIKSDSPRAFQQHQDTFQIPILFAVSILFNFH
jgi:hypothetical protein